MFTSNYGENFLIEDKTTEEEKKIQFDHWQTHNFQPNQDESLELIKAFCENGEDNWTTENMDDIITSWIKIMSIKSKRKDRDYNTKNIEFESWVASLDDNEDDGIFADVEEEVQLPVSDMSYRKVFMRKIPVLNMTTNDGLFVPRMNIRLNMKSDSMIFKNVKENNLLEKLKLGPLTFSTKTVPKQINKSEKRKTIMDYEGN